MDKKTSLISKKIASLRGGIQAAATLITNIHLPNLFKGKIYQGNAKTVCVPGLNCYSCPAATGACPIGAFQAVVGSSQFKFTYYITGFFILLGVMLVVCIPSSRQLKKYKIFVLPGWISGNIFMPPIVAFHEIPLVLRLQVLSVAGRLYSNLYIL